jgi:nicotinate phosphoribosyltransferase
MKYANFALLNDFYQITMANGYFQSGISEKTACFQLFFRKAPFSGNFAIACGLKNIIDYINCFSFQEDDLEYLSSMMDSSGNSLFEKQFIEYLKKTKFTCDIEAVPEGTVVFAQEPILKITGPILQCQLLETPILNILNFQTLIATKAARICQAAQNSEVTDFGFRRAHGFDGAISASRAAYIGGVHSTSNVFAAKKYGIPIKGTLGHSWVMAFLREDEAFLAYANAMPDNCIFVVDTYQTITGIQNAIKVGHYLKKKSHRLRGIRLDSGDLATLSRQARHMLDAAGFQDTLIIASGDLDEYQITYLKKSGAPIDAWGVGTRLITAFEEPALGGTYKLVAIKEENNWRSCSKISDDKNKTTIPGATQIRRYQRQGNFVADIIYDSFLEKPATKNIPKNTTCTDLLIPVFCKGQHVYQNPSIEKIRDYAAAQLNSLNPSYKRLKNPRHYGVRFDSMLI